MPFKKNINGSGTPTPEEKKPDTRTNDEIPIEELQNLIAEASKDLEVDAQKALEDLQKDKEIMKKLQEVKNRKKEDVNKGNNFDWLFLNTLDALKNNDWLFLNAADVL